MTAAKTLEVLWSTVIRQCKFANEASRVAYCNPTVEHWQAAAKAATSAKELMDEIHGVIVDAYCDVDARAKVEKAMKIFKEPKE